jgi:hypothetical protein
MLEQCKVYCMDSILYRHVSVLGQGQALRKLQVRARHLSPLAVGKHKGHAVGQRGRLQEAAVRADLPRQQRGPSQACRRVERLWAQLETH